MREFGEENILGAEVERRLLGLVSPVLAREGNILRLP